MAENEYVSKRGLRSTQTRLWRSALAIVAFIVVLSGNLFTTTLGSLFFYVSLAAVTILSGIMFAADQPERFKWYRVPSPVVLYLLFSALATIWVVDRSQHLLSLALQLVGTALAVLLAYLLTWQESLRTLATALRYLLFFSLGVWLWQKYFGTGEPTVSLSLIAVLSLAVFGVQFWAGLMRPFAGSFWTLFALAVLVLANSPVAYAAFVVVLISFLFALWARNIAQDARVPMYVIGATTLLVSIGLLAWKRAEVLPFIGIDPAVVQAENVWTSVLNNLGVIGLILFIMLVFVSTWRVWFRAVDQPRRGAGDPLEYAKSALWPFLTVMSLLVFSLVAATLVNQAGWFLLVFFAVKTRFDYIVPTVGDDTVKRAWRDVPIAA